MHRMIPFPWFPFVENHLQINDNRFRLPIRLTKTQTDLKVVSNLQKQP